MHVACYYGVYSPHSDALGPISSVTTFGQTLVILNDQSIAFELLEKRSSIYSSRPRFVFGGEMYDHIFVRLMDGEPPYPLLLGLAGKIL